MRTAKAIEPERRKSPLTKGDIAFNIFNYAFFGLFTLLCIFPFYYIFINTISDNTLVAAGRITLIPQGIHFQNYINALKLDKLLPSLGISVLRTVIGTGFVVLCASFPAYAFSRSEFWGRGILYKMVVATMYFNAGIIPFFLTYKALGIYNTFWVYILPTMVSPFNLILCKTYMESLPASLEESAEIDGAGYLTRYFQIIMPLSKPILATIAIFSAVSHWNNFMDTVLYIKDQKLFTLQYVLYQYLNESSALKEIMKNDPTAGQNMDLSTLVSPTTVRYTISILTVLPIMVVYPFFQKYFVKGIMIGAVKG